MGVLMGNLYAYEIRTVYFFSIGTQSSSLKGPGTHSDLKPASHFTGRNQCLVAAMYLPAITAVLPHLANAVHQGTLGGACMQTVAAGNEDTMGMQCGNRQHAGAKDMGEMVSG